MRVTRLGSAQTWKRILAELTLIVGGVLIALALDAWWGSRQERQRELAYVSQLLMDLRETESRLQASVAGDSATLEAVGAILDRAFVGPFPPPDSLRLPTGYSQFRPLLGTQLALIQSGEMELIQDDSLRFALISYSALIDATEAILQHTETLIWSATERVIHGRTRHSQTAIPTRANEMRRWGSVDVVAALNDPELVSALQVQAAASQNRIRNLERLEEPTATLISMLERELDGHR
jgi:hypothetical protein